MFVVKFLKDFLLGGSTIWYVIILGAIGYLWFDYQVTKKQNVILQRSVEDAVRGIEALKTAQVLKDKIAQNGAEAADAAQKENLAIMLKLASDVEKMKHLQRPPEQSNCTIHPALKLALQEIRAQRAAVVEGPKQ